jgi:hypothetical protein
VKRLLSVKVTRDHTPNEWISADCQATDAGRADFAERQKQRRIEAQAKVPAQPIPLRRKS